REALAAGCATGGAQRNEAWVADDVDWADIGPEARALLTDPQTSGGLLVALPPAQVPAFLDQVPDAVVIGAVEAAGDGPRLRLR
ncbi:MAG: selenide, water dikinase SelD, partial [Gemmatimonadetes bacterium]|nr:selenide, water dikinase SelD [Gemmatimonadota bacterium]